MKRIDAILFFALGTLPLSAQDVKMESTSSEDVLLKVENMSEHVKTLIKVHGDSLSDTGIDVRGVRIGIQVQGGVYGIKSIAPGSSYTWGVYGEGATVGVTGWSDNGTGVYGEGNNGGVTGSGSLNGNGINGYAGGSNYAGYFDGNVAVLGDCDPCSPSDKKFKKNIQPLEGGLTKIMALSPKTYEMRVEEFKGKVNFTEGKKYGLIAEDVAAVLPELVHTAKTPIKPTPGKGPKPQEQDRLEFQMISYSKLIPILIKAVQEQQALIQEQQASIGKLSAKVATLEVK